MVKPGGKNKMVTQVVSNEQVMKMRDENLAAINHLKAQARAMEIEAANADAREKGLKKQVMNIKRELSSLLTRQKRLDTLLRAGKVTTQGQTYLVQ
jgi:hypothetical protein